MHIWQTESDMTERPRSNKDRRTDHDHDHDHDHDRVTTATTRTTRTTTNTTTGREAATRKTSRGGVVPYKKGSATKIVLGIQHSNAELISAAGLDA